MRSRDPEQLMALAVDRVRSDEVLEWLFDSLAAYNREDRRIPLERFLGISQGKRRRIALRNLWLRRAYGLCSNSEPYPQVQELAREIERFRSQIAPGLRLRGGLRECDLSELRKALYRAFKQGCRVPDSPRQLWRIVTDIESPEMSAADRYSDHCASAQDEHEVNDGTA